MSVAIDYNQSFPASILSLQPESGDAPFKFPSSSTIPSSIPYISPLDP